MPTYLDYAATTPLDETVLDRMLPYLTEDYGNPSSIHMWGQRAEFALEESREQIAGDLGCAAEELIFTSGGSESDNLALRGAAFGARESRGANHILVSPVEHGAVSKTALDLAERHQFELEWLPVDDAGRVDPDALRDFIRSDTAVVSIIYGNNEIGTINPIRELATVAREHGVPFHTDALQATCQLSTRVDELGIDLLSIGAHKFYGPKGVGALYIRTGTQVRAIQTGGSQERGMRAGTSNVAHIVGLAAAHGLAMARYPEDAQRFGDLRDRIIEAVIDTIPGSRLTGHATQRLPNNASFVFEAVDGNSLLTVLDLAGFACSSGSACKTGDPEPSEVLVSLGMEPKLAMGSLRVTVGRQTVHDEVDRFTSALRKAITDMRQPVTAPQ